MEYSVELLGILFVIAMLAGTVDAICGGGGLIAIPVLMMAGCSPAQAIATNKLQSLFGKLSAVIYYLRRNMLDLRSLRWAALLAFWAGAVGAVALVFTPSDYLEIIIPFLLAALAGYLIFSPKLGICSRPKRISLMVFSLSVVPLLSLYDGFFGAASGSFFAVSFMLLLGQDVLNATASTKLMLLASNIAALGVFLVAGNVLWGAGLCMAAGQYIGCHYGSRLVVRKGARLVKPMLSTVCVLVIMKYVSTSWVH